MLQNRLISLFLFLIIFQPTIGFASSSTLTLDTALSLSQRGNSTLNTAASHLEEATSLSIKSLGTFFPSIEYVYNKRLIRDGKYHYFSGVLPLFDQGRSIQNLRIFHSEERAAQAELAQTEIDTSIKTVQIYLSAAAASERIDFLKKELETITLVKEKFEQFSNQLATPKRNYQRVLVEMSLLEDQLNSARNDRLVALDNLKSHLALPDLNNDVKLDKTREIPNPYSSQESENSITNSGLTNWRKKRAYDERIEQGDGPRKWLELSALLPKVSLAATYGTTTYGDKTREYTLSANLTFPIPLESIITLRPGLNAIAQQTKQLEIKRHQEGLDLQNQIVRRLARLRTVEKSLASTRWISSFSDENRTQFLREYKSGSLEAIQYIYALNQQRALSLRILDLKREREENIRVLNFLTGKNKHNPADQK